MRRIAVHRGRRPRVPKPKKPGHLHVTYHGVSRRKHPHYTYNWLRATLRAIDRVKIR